MSFRAYERARDDHLAHFAAKVEFLRRQEYRQLELAVKRLRGTARSDDERDCMDTALEAIEEARRACR